MKKRIKNKKGRSLHERPFIFLLSQLLLALIF
ncbi:hypothetical protein Y888_04775 [Mixta calida B021323]|nr:hypothetical protein Y888_04775 [Mixta calida B021323]